MGVKKKKSEEKAKNTLRSPESRLPQQESSKAEKSRLKKQTKALKLTKSTPAEDPCGEEAVDEQISSPKNKHPGGNTSAETDQKAIKEKYPPRLDPKSIGYFRRVDDTLQQKFDSEEEKRLFVKNVFGEVKENEVSLAMDITGSLVLQKLLALAQPLQLGQFLSALSKDFFSICCHRSGAHIVQTTLLQFPRLQALSHLPEENAEEEDEEAVTNTLEDLILMLCTDVKGRFLEYTQNTHGSFVVRTLFQVLGGTLLNQEKSRRGPPGATISKKKLNTSSTQAADFAVPESFLAQLQDLTGCFQEDISLFVTNKIASLGLQVALQVLHRKLPMVCSVLCDDVIRYLASRNPSAAGSPLSMYLKDQTTSRLLERIIEVSGKKQLKKLFKSQFQGQLLALSAHAIANFTVQRLITAMPSKKLAFHCLEPASRQIACSPLFLSLLSYEVYYGYEDGNSPLEHQAESERCLGDVNFHGSLLLQQLLHFTDPSPVLLSLAAMMEKDLVTLACSQAGSHVFDALLISDSIPEKKKKKVLRKLKGHYIKLACNKHGSRVLDRIWNAATLGVKQEMAQELASKEQELLKDQFGYHIVRNFALSHFLKRRRDWDEHQVAENKRRKMFAEILED
ncbi:nucleolar protein 9 isoform X3 [Ambystoma mexicanum]|uniref:nucleolar protein 9 isoform X3 n=1 Tax=Ambystoma mexicanum TaxID=8296 RepID=UPI0037E8765B